MSSASELHARIRALVLAVVLAATECQRLVQPPIDVAAVLGTSLRLPCRMELSSDYLEWLEYITDISGKRIFLSFMNNANKEIAESHPRRKRYSIQGNYDLEIKSVNWDDAGRYRCRLMLSGRHHDTDVIILDKVHCNRDVTIEEGKRTLFTCGIRYNSSSLSNKMPELRWYQGNTPLSGSIIFGDNYVKHSLNLYPYATDHGRTYTCRALFDSPPPHHQQTCKVKLSVLYAPRITKISPRKSSYRPGDLVECTAEGNPVPSFTWDRIHGRGPIRITGHILDISESMAGNNTYRCTAKNIIHSTNRGDSYDINFTVFVPPTTPAVQVSSPAGRTKIESSQSRCSVTSFSASLLALPIITLRLMNT